METCKPTLIQGELRSLPYTGGSESRPLYRGIDNPSRIQGDLTVPTLYRGIWQSDPYTGGLTIRHLNRKTTFPFINVQVGALAETDIP